MLLFNILTGDAVTREEFGAVEAELKEGDGIGLVAVVPAVVIVTTKIIVCGLLIGFVFCVVTSDITVIENIIKSDFDSPNGIFLATNNNSIEGLFVPPYAAFFMTSNGDIKGEFGTVIALHSGTHLATMGKGFGDGVAVQIVAFLSTVCGLIIGLFGHLVAPIVGTYQTYDNWVMIIGL